MATDNMNNRSMTTNTTSTTSTTSTGTRTVVGVFGDRTTAERAVRDLRQKGFTENEISIVAKDNGGTNQGSSMGTTNTDTVGDGVTTGATWGGLAGLALGAGALAIPGLGPIIAAGPIAAALTGAATGGIAGGLLDWGIPETEGRRYQEEVRQGGVLAAIRAESSRINDAAAILRQAGAKDVTTH
jgi:uncharacterized membrane protein